MDKIMNAKKLWDVCAVARGLRFYAPEMATLFFLKFTSENSEYFDVEISKLNSFNASWVVSRVMRKFVYTVW